MTRSAPRNRLAGAGVVTLGSLVANVAAYLLHLPASRWLGPELYGAFAALLSAQLLISVPALALQAVIARETVRGVPVGELRALARRTAGVVALVAVGVLWPISAVLSTSLWEAAAALTAGPLLCLLTAEQGLLQGRERFTALGGVLAAAGVGKVVPALTVIALGGDVAVALLAGAVGVAVVWIGARAMASPGDDDRTLAAASDVGDLPVAVGVGSVIAAGQVQLVLMALTSVDLLLARALLAPEDAGRYALGAVAAKAAFWLPVAVGTVLYPRMADPLSHRGAVRTAVGILSGIGAFVVAAALLAAPLVPALVGEAYEPVAGLLWAFAALGVVLSVLQALLISMIAANRTSLALVAWAGFAAVIVGALLVPREVEALLGVTIAVITATTLSSAALAARYARSD